MRELFSLTIIIINGEKIFLYKYIGIFLGTLGRMAKTRINSSDSGILAIGYIGRKLGRISHSVNGIPSVTSVNSPVSGF